jgi:competence protein ComFC
MLFTWSKVTLEEAHDALKKHDVNVLFALVLADAKEN